MLINHRNRKPVDWFGLRQTLGLLLGLIFCLELPESYVWHQIDFLPHTPLPNSSRSYGRGSEQISLFRSNAQQKSVVTRRIDCLLDNERNSWNDACPEMISSAMEIAEEMGDKEIEKGIGADETQQLDMKSSLRLAKKEQRHQTRWNSMQQLKNEIPYLVPHQKGKE